MQHRDLLAATNFVDKNYGISTQDFESACRNHENIFIITDVAGEKPVKDYFTKNHPDTTFYSEY
jgi:guanylate kinase